MSQIGYFLKGDFVKSVTVLMTGTLIAQFVSYGVSPIISRMYNQAEMADLNLFMRAVGFISALATARFELSLPLPKQDSHSYLLFRLSLKIALITLLACTFLGVLYVLINSTSFDYFFFGLLILVSSFFVVFINLGTNWSIRKGNFKSIAFSRISNSIVSNGLRIGFGLFQWGSIGLILATFIGHVVSSLGFIKNYFQSRTIFKNYASKKKTVALITEYREFPLVSLPHVLVDLGRDLIVAFLVIYFFGKEIFGSYSYALIMLSVPIAIIGQAIGQVFFKKCSDVINEGKDVLPLIFKTMKLLLVISFFPFTILFFFGEPIFGFVFGEEWRVAGYYSEILAIYMFFNFLVSPISNLPIILKRQKAYFFIGLVNTFSQLIAFGVLPLFILRSEGNFVNLLWMLTLAQSMVMIYTCIIFIRYARLGKKE